MKIDHKIFKMFTPERVSLLVFAATLCAWATVTMCRRTSHDTATPLMASDTMVTCDSDSVTHNDSVVVVSRGRKKEKSDSHRRSASRNHSKKKESQKRHRDHLNEPVGTF